MAYEAVRSDNPTYLSCCSTGNFNADFSVRIDAFVNVLVRYLKVSEQYATGLTAQIQAQ